MPLLDQAWLTVSPTDPRGRAHREAVRGALPGSVARFTSPAPGNDCPTPHVCPQRVCTHACTGTFTRTKLGMSQTHLTKATASRKEITSTTAIKGFLHSPASCLRVPLLVLKLHACVSLCTCVFTRTCVHRCVTEQPCTLLPREELVAVGREGLAENGKRHQPGCPVWRCALFFKYIINSGKAGGLPSTLMSLNTWHCYTNNSG